MLYLNNDMLVTMVAHGELTEMEAEAVAIELQKNY